MTARVRGVLEDDTARELFHLFELLTQFPIVGDGRFHLGKLFCGQGDGNGLLRHFAGPLVAGPSAFARGPILD